MSAPPQLPFEQTHPLQVPPALRVLQTEGSIHRVRTAVGHDAWLVTSHPRVRHLLDDDRLGRTHPAPETAARTGESALFGGPMGNFETEWADHARMRSLLQPHFTPKRMRALRPRVEALTTQLIDDLIERSRPADLHAAVALPLPILVICELLGVPYDDRAEFRTWTQAAADVADRARSEQGLGDLFGYGMKLVARKREHPDDDVISRLCATDGVSDAEAAMLAMSLLFAGHETTVVQIGVGALMLLTNPDQWQSLRSDPALLPNAVEEILRAPGKGGGGIPRYARTDLEIDGVQIAAGDLVLLDTGAANHDPNVFTNPDRAEVAREGVSAHLSFGHGMRYCIGAPLARIELQAVFAQLLQRLPTMRVAINPADIQLTNDTLVNGPTELPVTW